MNDKHASHNLMESLGWFTGSKLLAEVGVVTGNATAFLAAAGTAAFGIAALVRALTELYREWRKPADAKG